MNNRVARQAANVQATAAKIENEVRGRGRPQRRRNTNYNWRRRRNQANRRNSGRGRPNQRRGGRGRGKRPQNRPKTLPNGNVVSVQASQKAPQDQGATATAKVLMENTHLHKYTEAQVDPFSAAAVGAVRPDSHSGNKFPTVDWTKLTLTPSAFQEVNQQSGAIANPIEAFMVFFMPRNLATGWLSGPEIIAGTPPEVTYKAICPFTMWNEEGEIIIPTDSYNQLRTSTETPFADPYCLFLLAITFDGFTVRQATPAEASGDKIISGYTAMRYGRVPTFKGASSGCRVNGAGIKLKPTAPPLQTGGFCYAGTFKPRELYNLLVKQQEDITAGESVGPFKGVKNSILNPVGYKAIEGVTARYVPNNDDVQHQFQETFIDLPPLSYSGFTEFRCRHCLSCYVGDKPTPRNYRKVYFSTEKGDLEMKTDDIEDYPVPFSINVKKAFDKAKKKKVTVLSYENETATEYYKRKRDQQKYSNLRVPEDQNELSIKVFPNNGLATLDLCKPDDPVPCLYFGYDFELNSGTQTLKQVNNYNLEFQAVCHGEQEPKGNSAIISVDPKADPALTVVEDFIGDAANIPQATSGNSFKSIFQDIGRMSAHVAKFASRADKITKILTG